MGHSIFYPNLHMEGNLCHKGYRNISSKEPTKFCAHRKQTFKVTTAKTGVSESCPPSGWEGGGGCSEKYGIYLCIFNSSLHSTDKNTAITSGIIIIEHAARLLFAFWHRIRNFQWACTDIYNPGQNCSDTYLFCRRDTLPLPHPHPHLMLFSIKSRASSLETAFRSNNDVTISSY